MLPGIKSLQHQVFPGGHPSKYKLGSTLLNFGDRTRTGVFSVIWQLTIDNLLLRESHSFTG